MTRADEETSRDERARLRRLERISFVEATTLLLLVGVAVPLEHLGGFPNAVHLMGPVHGLAFVAYAWTVLCHRSVGKATGEHARSPFSYSWKPVTERIQSMPSSVVPRDLYSAPTKPR